MKTSKKGEADALLEHFSSAIGKWTEAMRLNADMGQDAERLWDLKAFTDNLVIGQTTRPRSLRARA